MISKHDNKNLFNASRSRVPDYFLGQRNLCTPHRNIWIEHSVFSQFSHDFKELKKKI